ncbi:MAG: sulfatase-like hydrolase/transferase [Cocleimonas sp.]
MKKTSNPFLICSLKIVALLAFIYFTNQGFVARLNYLIDTDNYQTIVVFGILWVFSISILILTSFQQNTFIRLFWAIVIAFATAVSYGFYAAGGSELEVLDVLELWQARHETGRAFEHFQYPLIKAIIVAILGFVIIVYPVPKIKNKTRIFISQASWLPIVPIFLFGSLIFIKSDKAVAGLPQQFSPTSMSAVISYKLANHEIPTRKIVADKPVTPAKTEHLLYLVDESINPNYLYSKQGKLLKGFVDHQNKIADFGTSISGSNCSARSNAILRLGATRENLINSIKTNPSIWQYAKKAGFRTVYIDSQASGNVATKPNDFQNYMGSVEATLIDKFYKVKNVPTPELDYQLLEIIKEELASDIPTFIYANKNGAHFPYGYNYPESEAVYQPVVTNNDAKGFGGLIDLYQSDKSMQSVINMYKNSIRWTVDLFFQRFFNEINLDNTVVIYTSDHGQYFHPDKTTHCTSGDGAPATEGIVPLMLMTNNKTLLSDFNKAAEINYDGTDHFSIFPTVLNLFGYSKKEQNLYGVNLFEPINNDVAAFNTGDILGIISKDTIWREVSKEERIEFTPNIHNPLMLNSLLTN